MLILALLALWSPASLCGAIQDPPEVVEPADPDIVDGTCSRTFLSPSRGAAFSVTATPAGAEIMVVVEGELPPGARRLATGEEAHVVLEDGTHVVKVGDYLLSISGPGESPDEERRLVEAYLALLGR